jgi:hypothetical protein
MSVRKSRLIGKILTGLLTTIVAPVLAAIVSQQVGDWQQTLSALVENELPAAKSQWNQPSALNGANTFQIGGRERPSRDEKPAEARRVPLWNH